MFSHYSSSTRICRYTGHIPGLLNRIGCPTGMVTRMRAVHTPEIIPGNPPNRVLFSAHGGFRGRLPSRPLTGAAAAPFHTDAPSSMERVERYGTPSRPGTGMVGGSRPPTGGRLPTGSRPVTGQGFMIGEPRPVTGSRPGTGFQNMETVHHD